MNIQSCSVRGRHACLCILVAALFLSTINSQLSTCFAQGSIVPTTAPSVPIMKTLDQVEARTPISTVPFTISTSGSYYLTSNIAVSTGNAITIAADDVTLDLNGFTISSSASPASGTAVLLSSTRKNVTVKNGHIRGTTTFSGTFTTGGFLDGIINSSSSSLNLRVSDVSVLGLGDDGIDFALTSVPSMVIERCTVSICGGTGIRAALVRDCVALTTGDTAIASDCAINSTGETVSSVAGSNGVSGLSVVQNSIGTSVSGNGVQGQQVTNSFGTSTSGNGLNATNALNCQGVSTSGTNGINIAAGGSATFCRGRRDGGVAISAANGNAIGCGTIGSGTVTAMGKFLGTP